MISKGGIFGETQRPWPADRTPADLDELHQAMLNYKKSIQEQK